MLAVLYDEEARKSWDELAGRSSRFSIASQVGFDDAIMRSVMRLLRLRVLFHVCRAFDRKAKRLHDALFAKTSQITVRVFLRLLLLCAALRFGLASVCPVGIQWQPAGQGRREALF